MLSKFDCALWLLFFSSVLLENVLEMGGSQYLVLSLGFHEADQKYL